MNAPEKVSLLAVSCREASRLASAALDRELTRRERWALRIHTMLCGPCRKFAAQLASLRELLGKMPDNLRKELLDDSTRLSPQRRTQIKQLLADANEAESRK